MTIGTGRSLVKPLIGDGFFLLKSAKKRTDGFLTTLKPNFFHDKRLLKVRYTTGQSNNLQKNLVERLFVVGKKN